MDILDQLKKSGLSVGMINDALLEKVAEKFEGKLTSLKNMAKENTDYKVFLVHGEDSPYKDQFCAAVMKWYMITFNKTGRWMQITAPFDENLGNAGITVFPATYLYSPMMAQQLATVIREKLPMGKAFILCSNNKEAYDKTFGEDFMAFVSHASLSIEVSVPRKTISVI